MILSFNSGQYDRNALRKRFFTNRNYTFNENNATSVRKHIHQNKHDSTFNDFNIIGSARNNFELLLKESIIISMTKPNLNNTKESMPLYVF